MCLPCSQTTFNSLSSKLSSFTVVLRRKQLANLKFFPLPTFDQCWGSGGDGSVLEDRTEISKTLHAWKRRLGGVGEAERDSSTEE